MNRIEAFVIGVDFDGTVVEHDYPRVGADLDGAASSLREMVHRGARLVLTTMRSGDELADAVKWFADHNIPLFGVNANPEQHTWTTSSKAYCHVYVDDAGLGCPLVPGRGRPNVDWWAAAPMLVLAHDEWLQSRRP